MKVYNDYLNTITKALKFDKKYGKTKAMESHYEGTIDEQFSYKDFKNSIPEKKLLPSLSEFADELGLTPNFDQQLGLHPDFAHLKHTQEIEKHYIVSKFIDIKGSTNLFKRYEPETILIITNTIQRAAIHTCLVFGGYVHRLQGDGLFVYFGGKSIKKSDAVLNSLRSASMFTYFVKNDLQKLFNEQGIENIYTRIGIDLGFDDDVAWAKAGIGEISEVTTCSLHTSLATKMQAKAISNGIVIGDNLTTVYNDIKGFITPVCHRTNKEKDRYIFEIPDENFRYTQYDFDWYKFLKKQPYIAVDLDSNLILKKRRMQHERKPEYLTPIVGNNKPYLSKR